MCKTSVKTQQKAPAFCPLPLAKGADYISLNKTMPSLFKRMALNQILKYKFFYRRILDDRL